MRNLPVPVIAAINGPAVSWRYRLWFYLHFWWRLKMMITILKQSGRWRDQKPFETFLKFHPFWRVGILCTLHASGWSRPLPCSGRCWYQSCFCFGQVSMFPLSELSSLLARLLLFNCLVLLCPLQWLSQFRWSVCCNSKDIHLNSSPPGWGWLSQSWVSTLGWRQLIFSLLWLDHRWMDNLKHKLFLLKWLHENAI